MSYRDEWKEHKASMESSGIKMSDIADKAKFGPLLDDFDDAQKAYDKTPGRDPKALEKPAAELAKAAKAAVTAGQKYLQVLDYLEKNGELTKPQEKALNAATMWLGRTIVALKKIAK